MAVAPDGVVEGRRNRLADWAGPALVAAGFACSGLAAVSLGPVQARSLYNEDGPVEVATAVLFVVVAVLYLVWRSNIGVRSLVPPSLLMLMSVRELDGDKWFTEKSVLSTGYYFDNPGVPYGERIVVGLVALAIAFVVLRFLWLARTQILTSLRAFQPFCRSIITGIVLLVASPFLDGLGRTFEMFGAQLGVTARATAIIVEETAELGIALAFLVALLQLRFDPAHNALPRGPESPRAADPRGPVGPRPAKGRATQNSRA